MNENQIGSWVDTLHANGRYSFQRQEVTSATGLSSDAVQKTLVRLTKRKRIAKINDYFYTIVPTEYLNSGSPPASWFINHLMEAMKRPYYVGVLTAASLHGASHHQPQEFQVVTNASVRTIKVARQQLHFFTKRSFEKTPTVEIKTPTGMIRVSSPEATALDLVHFAKAAGQLGNVATILRDLSEKINPELLITTAERQGAIPALQRLAYLLELVGAHTITGSLATWFSQHRPRTIRLRPDLPGDASMKDKKWNLVVNDKIEVDA